jgi:glutamate--cysteine ligase catalytic subunit
MGLLVEGRPLDWHAALPHIAYVKKAGIRQFLNLYERFRLVETPKFLWGDEVEMTILNVDDGAKTVRLCLRGGQVLRDLVAAKALLRDDADDADDAAKNEKEKEGGWNAAFLPEYGCFMVEGTPARPYGGFTTDLRLVEANMALRRALVTEMLLPDERCVSWTAFPLMGGCASAAAFTTPVFEPLGDVARSLYVPDQMISAHPRFATLTRNIRARRGAKVCIKVPLLQDKHTAAFVAANPAPAEAAALHDETKEIYMDAMAFGMGASCLQVSSLSFCSFRYVCTCKPPTRDKTHARQTLTLKHQLCCPAGDVPGARSRGGEALVRSAGGRGAHHAGVDGVVSVLARQNCGDGRPVGRHLAERRRPHRRGARRR